MVAVLKLIHADDALVVPSLHLGAARLGEGDHLDPRELCLGQPSTRRRHLNGQPIVAFRPLLDHGPHDRAAHEKHESCGRSQDNHNDQEDAAIQAVVLRATPTTAASVWNCGRVR